MKNFLQALTQVYDGELPFPVRVNWLAEHFFHCIPGAAIVA